MKWLHNLMKGLSLTTALFIFQACYGTPDWLHDGRLQFKVVAADTGEPLKDVYVSSRVQAADNLDWIPCGVTNDEGMAYVYFGMEEGMAPQFRFEMVDSDYMVKDTIIVDTEFRTVEIPLTKAE
jgi:hypothetical protein